MHSGRRFRFLGSVIIACAATMTASQAAAQSATEDPEPPPAAPEQDAGRQQLFKSNCSFCHGSDGRGGETGPNLVRDQVVLADQHGELIAPVVQNGIPGRGMPKLTLSATEIADIAAWLHSQPLSDRGTPSTLDILVGNVKEGEAYFNGAGHCAQCHSVTGDLAAIGARHEPKTIQNLIVSGGGGRSFGRRSAGAAAPKVPPTTVTVTLPSGQTITGDLDHISAFVVALRDRKSTRLNSSHGYISYAVFCLKKKTKRDGSRAGVPTNGTPAIPRVPRAPPPCARTCPGSTSSDASGTWRDFGLREHERL